MTDAAVTAAEKTLRDFLEPWLDDSVHGTTLGSQIHAAAHIVVRDARPRIVAAELEDMRPELEARITRQIEPLFAALGELLVAVAEECPLTDRVVDAADKVRVAMVALGMRDIGPPPGGQP